MSRTRLERIIQDFNLYANERKTGIMEDIVEQMRRDINSQVVRGDAFRISYQGDNPRTVMRVTERLAALFIEENLRDREVLHEGTNQFLEAQLEDARRRLVEHEKKLEDYRREHAGQLPSQLDSNLQVLQSAQMQIQNRHRIDQPRPRPPVGAGAANRRPGAAARTLAAARIADVEPHRQRRSGSRPPRQRSRDAPDCGSSRTIPMSSGMARRVSRSGKDSWRTVRAWPKRRR